MTDLVIDCSVTMARCFPDETSDLADAALDALVDGQGFAPPLWLLEVANVLAIGERRGRLTVDDSTAFTDLLSRLPIHVESTASNRTFGAILSLTRGQQVTAYDASYLELANRRSLPIATLDDRLAAAAATIGIEVVPI